VSGQSLYTYVWNNPTNNTDPTGFLTQTQQAFINHINAVLANGGTVAFEGAVGDPMFAGLSGVTGISNGTANQTNSTSMACYAPSQAAQAKGGASGEVRASESNLFRDNLIGRIAADIASPIALFTKDNINPLSGNWVNFNGDKRAEAAIGLMTMFMPAARGEKAAMTEMPSILSWLNPCKCFVAGTPVQTPDGFKPIEKIEVGDLVTARDEDTGETAWKPVLRVIRNGEKDVVRVSYVDNAGRNESLGVTPEHPFMLEGMRWVEAGKLKRGDKIMTLDGALLTVKRVSKYSVRHHTYNFEVADFHTYFVGKSGAWVHNSNCDLIAKLLEYGGPGGGHHVPAKSAFNGAAGYDALKALAIPNAELDALNISHSVVTGAQMTGYRAFAKTGEQLTWNAMNKIETNALIRGGMNPEMAQRTVTKAIDALKTSGVTGPTRIPWGN